MNIIDDIRAELAYYMKTQEALLTGPPTVEEIRKVLWGIKKICSGRVPVPYSYKGTVYLKGTRILIDKTILK